jgi:hypothetical protein
MLAAALRMRRIPPKAYNAMNMHDGNATYLMNSRLTTVRRRPLPCNLTVAIIETSCCVTESQTDKTGIFVQSHTVQPLNSRKGFALPRARGILLLSSSS